jgi:hypothetical protein
LPFVLATNTEVTAPRRRRVVRGADLVALAAGGQHVPGYKRGEANLDNGGQGWEFFDA